MNMFLFLLSWLQRSETPWWQPIRCEYGLAVSQRSFVVRQSDRSTDTMSGEQWIGT